MTIRKNYNHTLYASYLGYITQAIVNNFAPLLFLTFQKQYAVSLEKIALLVTFNFGIQLLTDLVAARYIERIGYRIGIVAAHILAAAGLAGMAVLPELFGNHYAGLLAAVCIYAVGGGLIEVLISPIVEACPTERKASAMSLLHSFYCWGTVIVVVLSTLFFAALGIGSWKVLAVIWAVFPALNAFYFSQVPLAAFEEDMEGMNIRQLVTERMFWILVLVMVCAGAAEQSISQWASSFAESALGIGKSFGDLFGICAFAVLMGSARMLYAKYDKVLPLRKVMLISGGLCVFSYLVIALSPIPVISLAGCALCGFSVGILWPGTFSIATGSVKGGGTAMFALLALAGDLGCSGGPTLVGMISGRFGNNLKLGILAAVIFPVLLLVGILLCRDKASDL